MTKKLSVADGFRIQASLELGMSQKQLAKKYGVNQSTISRMAREKLENVPLARKRGTGLAGKVDTTGLAFLIAKLKKSQNRIRKA